MENPFELILERLDRIERKIDNLENFEPKVELMNVTQLAEYLDLSKATIYGKVHRDDIPYIKKGKRLRFRKNKIDNWLSSGQSMTKEDIKRKANEYIFKNSRFI